MENRISEIRKSIRALRFCLLVAEETARHQVLDGYDCSEMAADMLVMRAELAGLCRERIRLGDREQILVQSFTLPRRHA